MICIKSNGCSISVLWCIIECKEPQNLCIILGWPIFGSTPHPSNAVSLAEIRIDALVVRILLYRCTNLSHSSCMIALTFGLHFLSITTYYFYLILHISCHCIFIFYKPLDRSMKPALPLTHSNRPEQSS